MLSFRSILLAAAAFATVASAIPTPDAAARGLTDPLNPLGSLGGAVGGTSRRGEGEDHVEPYHKGHKYIPECFQKCHDDVKVYTDQIHDHCHGRSHEEVDHEFLIGLFGKIIIVLKVLIVELKEIVIYDLYLDGVLCSIKELAGIIGGLLILIIEVIFVVIKLLGFVDVVLCGLLTEISGLLCEILGLVLHLVGGLLIEIVFILTPYRDHCHEIHYVNLLGVLGL